MWSRRLGPRLSLGITDVLTINQMLVMAVGIITILALMQAIRGPFSLPIAAIVATLFAVVVFKRQWGMPLANWMLKAVAHKTGPKRWHARPVGRDVEQLPREVAGAQIVAVRDRKMHKAVGMLRDGKALIAVARVDLQSLGLFDQREQSHRLDAFKRILDDLARTHDDPQYRVQLILCHQPRKANGTRDYVNTHVPADKLGTPQAKAMLEVVENTEAASHEDTFYVAIRQSEKSKEQSAANLIDRLRTLMERLERAEISIRTIREPLEPRDLARLVKDQFDPFGRHIRDELEQITETNGTDPALAWPDWRVRHVDCYETDNTVHSTLWMRGWPPTEVGPGWLKPLTLECDVPAMTISTILKPDEKGRAVGTLRRKQTRVGSFTLFRRHHGQDDRVEHGTRDEYLLRQQQEIAGGASPWRWEMYVTVSAPREPPPYRQLADSIAKAEAACMECGLTPVPLRFDHEHAFTFTLPMGRGLEPEKARL